MTAFLDELFTSASENQQTPGVVSVGITVSIAISPPSNNLADPPLTPSPVIFGYSSLTFYPARDERVGRFGVFRAPAYFTGSFFASTEAFTGFEVDDGERVGEADQSTGWMGLILTAPQIVAPGGVSNYIVTVSGLGSESGISFVPSIDPTTNAIFGAADIYFVAISLSSLSVNKMEVPQ